MTAGPATAVAAVSAALAEAEVSGAAVVGLSGGPDSVGLVCLLTAARPDLRLTAVHVRHGGRDDRPDVAAASACADRFGLALRIEDVDVRPGAEGWEAAARRERYRVLAAAASAAGAGVVAVGHTADDQAETVLLALARGCGLGGLAGMAPRRRLDGRVTLVRPLLSVRRSEVLAVARASGLPLATDPTNTDPRQRRARARHGLLPALAGLTGGGTDPVTALARLSDLARADDEALSQLAIRAVDRDGGCWGPVHWVDAARLSSLPLAVASRVVRLLVGRAACRPGPAGSAATVAGVLALRPGQALSLPGSVVATAGGGRLACAPAPEPTLVPRDVHADVLLDELGLHLRLGGTPPAAAVLPPWAPAGAAICAPVDAGPLVVRARRAGDRIVTRAGTQAVAAAMADAGIPRCARGLVPVVADAAGVLWVPGVGVRAGADGARRVWLEALPAPSGGPGAAAALV